MLPETYPKDRYSPQSHVSYELTDHDLLQLYALFTPSEILREFKSDRVRSIKSIYNLISRYKLDRPVQAKKYLQRVVLAACPEEIGFEDWEKVYEQKIEYVRAEALSRLWKRIGKHESLWAEE
ncbi:hypothetical protein OAD32_02295 [Porticoccaceae bacterium]|nr:hypothetical protein [Porticoccaceae bacterium]